MLNNTNIGLCI